MKPKICGRRFFADCDRKHGIALGKLKSISASLMLLAVMVLGARSGLGPMPVVGADAASDIRAIARPAVEFTQILFHGKKGPYLLQTRSVLDAAAPWVDMTNALVTEVETGVLVVYCRTARMKWDSIGWLARMTRVPTSQAGLFW